MYLGLRPPTAFLLPLPLHPHPCLQVSHPETDSAPACTTVGPGDASAGTQLLGMMEIKRRGALRRATDRAQMRGTTTAPARAPAPRPGPHLPGVGGWQREELGEVPPASVLLALRSAGGRAAVGVRGARGGPPAGRPGPGMSAGAKESPRGGAAAGPTHTWMHFKSTFRNTPARAGAEEPEAFLTCGASSRPGSRAQ